MSKSRSNKTNADNKLPADHRPGIEDPSYWHKTSYLTDGTPIGRLGAYWYLLDQNNCAVSNGYHEIFCNEHGDYIGRRSSHTEPVVLHNEPTHS